MMFGIQPGGRFTTVNVPLWELIRRAYGLQRSQLVGGPDWIETARFDIVAKGEGDIARGAGQVDRRAAELACCRIYLKIVQVALRIARRASCRFMRSRWRGRDGKLGAGSPCVNRRLRGNAGLLAVASGPPPRVWLRGNGRLVE